ncbi:hypothetical protein ACFLVI_02435 [Chloroflexota bacterium]
MEYIVMGLLGFLCGYLSDLFSLKRIPGAKQLLGAVALGLISYSLVMVCLKSNSLLLPLWATWVGWLLFPLSLILLMYSLIIEIPLKKTYMADGTGQMLIRSGTYALVRHPGVLAYALLLLSLFLVSKSELLLIAAPVWLLVDILWVLAQDRFILDKAFPEYKSYRKETPVLFPNMDSINAFLHTFKWGGALVGTAEGGKLNVKHD